jgi:hypothetical protein
MKTFPANTIVTFERTDVDLGGYKYRLLSMEEVEECGYDSKGYSLVAISPDSTKAIADTLHFEIGTESIGGEDHAVLTQFEFEDGEWSPFDKNVNTDITLAPLGELTEIPSRYSLKVVVD